MANFEVAVSLHNYEHLTFPILVGDIVSWKDMKTDRPWTDNEKKIYLIVVLEKITLQEVRRLAYPSYDDGLDYDPPIVEEAKKPKPRKMLKKRRYSIPVTQLQSLQPSFNWTLVTSGDKGDYQPFLASEIKLNPKTTDVVWDKELEEYNTTLTDTTGVGN
jgi:hypothetical protein